jgi:hypothetical protein
MRDGRDRPTAHGDESVDMTRTSARRRRGASSSALVALALIWRSTRHSLRVLRRRAKLVRIRRRRPDGVAREIRPLWAARVRDARKAPPRSDPRELASMSANLPAQPMQEAAADGSRLRSRSEAAQDHR